MIFSPPFGERRVREGWVEVEVIVNGASLESHFEYPLGNVVPAGQIMTFCLPGRLCLYNALGESTFHANEPEFGTFPAIVTNDTAS